MANRASTKNATKPKAAKAHAGRSDDHDEDLSVEFDDEKFRAHVKNVRALKTKSAELRGQIGAAVKNAEEDYGIHRAASALWIKLDGMEEEARIAFLRAFDDMRTALGYAHQGDLLNDTYTGDPATFVGRG